MNTKKTENYLKLGVFGAVLTLIGCIRFKDGANMLDGYQKYVQEDTE